MTYGQVKTASRSSSAIQIAEQEGWSKTGKYTLFQEGYAYNRKIVIEMENIIKMLKIETKELQRNLDTMKGLRAIDILG